MKRRRDYGYVVRGQVFTYSVPISPVAGVANATCSSPACGSGGGFGGFDIGRFCKEHTCLCLLGALLVGYMVLK